MHKFLEASKMLRRGDEMAWKQFAYQWETVLKGVREKDPEGLLNLFEDVSVVRELMDEDAIYSFARSLYCYDLVQQVCTDCFSEHLGEMEHEKIGSRGDLSLSGRLSPASMPLALLSGKLDEFQSVSKDDYQTWQENELSFRHALFDLDYDELPSIAPTYFQSIGAYRSSKLREFVRSKHYEIDSLISTRRFKHLHQDCSLCRRLDCYCDRDTSTLRVSMREVLNSDYETQMFQKIWFTPEPEADTVSVSANLSGFTMINAVSRALGYDWELVKQVAEVANERHEVIFMSDLSPRLIIVPKTRGKDYPPTRRLLTQVLGEANAHETKVLHMTHYGFCNGLSKSSEPLTIFRDLMYPHLKTTIERVIFDYDTRASRQIFSALKESVVEYKPRFV